MRPHGQFRQHLGLGGAQRPGTTLGPVAYRQVGYHLGERAAEWRLLRERRVHRSLMFRSAPMSRSRMICSVRPLARHRNQQRRVSRTG